VEPIKFVILRGLLHKEWREGIFELLEDTRCTEQFPNFGDCFGVEAEEGRAGRELKLGRRELLLLEPSLEIGDYFLDLLHHVDIGLRGHLLDLLLASDGFVVVGDARVTAAGVPALEPPAASELLMRQAQFLEVYSLESPLLRSVKTSQPMLCKLEWYPPWECAR
jgi:hypothetical protein